MFGAPTLHLHRSPVPRLPPTASVLAEVDAWSKHHRALERVAAWSIILAKEQEIAVSISASLSAIALTAKLLNSGDCGEYLTAMHHGVALQLLGCGGRSGSVPLSRSICRRPSRSSWLLAAGLCDSLPPTAARSLSLPICRRPSRSSWTPPCQRATRQWRRGWPLTGTSCVPLSGRWMSCRISCRLAAGLVLLGTLSVPGACIATAAQH